MVVVGTCVVLAVLSPHVQLLEDTLTAIINIADAIASLFILSLFNLSQDVPKYYSNYTMHVNGQTT